MVLYMILCLVCRYINALEVASGNFSASLEKNVILRKEEELSAALANRKRDSNCETLFYLNIKTTLVCKCFTYGNLCLNVCVCLWSKDSTVTFKNLAEVCSVIYLFIFCYFISVSQCLLYVEHLMTSWI